MEREGLQKWVLCRRFKAKLRESKAKNPSFFMELILTIH